MNLYAIRAIYRFEMARTGDRMLCISVRPVRAISKW